ncbi:MAG: VWA domain-containing protein [Chloroflexales bacterium]|nr:VWA domain-containing protein [Chloroflexales bacterium]
MAIPHKRTELYPGLPLTGGMLVPVNRELSPLPLQHTDVRVGIIGPLADVWVTQQFQNTHTRPLEAIYVFPLPEDAAVTDLTLTIGERVIRGEIREREQARRDYEQARAMGQGAALLEQERPNVFTISVANIQPGEAVQTALHFHDRVPYDDGTFTFTFPTVVLPRYVPAELDAVPDAERITATPLLPKDTRDGHTISLRLELDAGKLVELSSPTHEIDVQGRVGRTLVTLRQADAIPNKDFILRYRVAGNQFTAATFTYRPAGQPGTLLLMLAPKVEVTPEEIFPRELLFVFDRSGSMSGDSIVQARNALRACLRALNPGDTFNIFPFDNRVEQFAPQALPFTQKSVDRADAYLERIDARGGTEILAALRMALQQPRDPERMRVLVFLTDGAVGNEDQVLRELRGLLNEARVYAFGIGSAVNRFLLDKLAEVGRGVVEYIFPGQAIEDAVQRFQNRAAFPVLTDLQIDWGGMSVTDALPDPLPDLYAGQPLLLLARFRNPQPRQTQVRLRGRTRRGYYEQALETDWPAATPDRGEHWAALPRVWARARIDALLTRERFDPRQKSQVRDEILSLALEQRLLSPYTAFVAIEERRAEHADRAPAETVLVPIHLPQGTHREAFEAPQPHLRVGGMLYAAAHLSAPLPAPAGGQRTRGIFHKMSQVMRQGFDDQVAGIEAGAATSFDVASQPPDIATPSTTVSNTQRYEAALRYLARTQGVSGAWAESPLATALVLLAFLCGGHSDRAGKFRPQLTRAVRWLSEQAEQLDVAPVVAWALAELGAATGAAPHHHARDVALAHAAPLHAIDQECLALARGERAASKDKRLDIAPLPGDERGWLALALRVWGNPAVSQDIASLMAQHQRRGGSADGAITPPDQRANKPGVVGFAATAAGAIAWAMVER